MENRDIGALVALAALLVSGIVYVVTLNNKISALENSVVNDSEIERIEGIINGKASITDVSNLSGKVEFLQGDKDFSSILQKKDQALSEFELFVDQKREEIKKLNEERVPILEELAGLSEKISDVRGIATTATQTASSALTKALAADNFTCAIRNNSSGDYVEASCQTGEVMTGGGCLHNQNAGHRNISWNRPMGSNKWGCAQDGVDQSEAYAICCKLN